MSIDIWLTKEFNRIVKIEDMEEHNKQLALLDAIVVKKNEYDLYMRNYKKLLLKNDMEEREIYFEERNNMRISLIEDWELNFANGLTREDKERILFNEYRWHAFSYGVKEALMKAKARQAFNRARKNHVYVFYQNANDVFYIDKAEKLKSSDFDMEQDVYVADSDMKWTYIYTHEIQCGPYFVRKK